MALGSAAMAAWTAAIFSASEFTQLKPELWATSANSDKGRTNGCSFGMPVVAAATGALTRATTGATTGAGAGFGASAAGATDVGAGCATSAACTGAASTTAVGTGVSVPVVK